MPFTAAALELPARFGAPDAQLEHARALLYQVGPVDLALLPETALTGYVSPRGDFDLTRFAEPLEGATSAALHDLAKTFNTLVVGPLIERDGARCFNTLVGIAPDGTRVLHYRKRHPWFPETWATAGDTAFPLVEWRGARLTTAICFDVHFLSDDAGPQLDAADLLLFPSAWVEDEPPPDAATLEPTREELLLGLATRHRVSVLNANWGRGAPAIRGQGESMCVTPEGTVRASLDAQPLVLKLGA